MLMIFFRNSFLQWSGLNRKIVHGLVSIDRFGNTADGPVKHTIYNYFIPLISKRHMNKLDQFETLKHSASALKPWLTSMTKVKHKVPSICVQKPMEVLIYFEF